MQGGFFILVRAAAVVVWRGEMGLDSIKSSLFMPIFLSPSLPLLYVSLIMFITQPFPLLIINFFPREKFGLMAGFGFWDLLPVVGSARGGLGFERKVGGEGGVMYR